MLPGKNNNNNSNNNNNNNNNDNNKIKNREKWLIDKKMTVKTLVGNQKNFGHPAKISLHFTDFFFIDKLDHAYQKSNTFIDNAEDLDVVVPMYNLLEYVDNYLNICFITYISCI